MNELGLVGELQAVKPESRACHGCTEPTKVAYTIVWKHARLPLCYMCAYRLQGYLESALPKVKGSI